MTAKTVSPFRPPGASQSSSSITGFFLGSRRSFQPWKKVGNTAAVNSEGQDLTLENLRGRRHPRAGGVWGSTLSQVGEGNCHPYRVRRADELARL
jgi:hypothetical protein